MLLRALMVAAVAQAAAADEVKKGAQVYKQLCAHCHGIDMVSPGTGSFDLRKFPRDDPGRFAASVLNGRGDMPAWADMLVPGEIEALWAYVATRGGREPMPGPAPRAEAPETLTVCLARQGGVMSSRRAGGGVGLDYAMAGAVAARLGAAFEPLWWETEARDDADPEREVGALLSSRRCDLAAGWPLYEGALGEPPAPAARGPRWLGQARDWTGDHAPGPADFVALAPLAGGAPYARIELAFALGPAAAGREPRAFEDLAGLRVGVAQGTMAGAITELQAPARDALVTADPGPTFLWRLENGDFDAALVATPEFDLHRRQNPLTHLRLSAWRHPFGMNVGFAATADRADLLAAVEAATAALLAEGAPARFADAAGATYAAPREPVVAPRLDLAGLAALR